MAIVGLTKKVGRTLSETYSAISLHEIKPERDRSRGLFLVVGYPQAWLRVFPDKVESDPLPFISRFYEGSPKPTAEIAYDPAIQSPRISSTTRARASGELRSRRYTPGVKAP